MKETENLIWGFQKGKSLNFQVDNALTSRFVVRLNFDFSHATELSPNFPVVLNTKEPPAVKTVKLDEEQKLKIK